MQIEFTDSYNNKDRLSHFWLIVLIVLFSSSFFFSWNLACRNLFKKFLLFCFFFSTFIFAFRQHFNTRNNEIRLKTLYICKIKILFDDNNTEVLTTNIFENKKWIKKFKNKIATFDMIYTTQNNNRACWELDEKPA